MKLPKTVIDNRVSVLVHRAAYTLRTYGLFSFLKQACLYLVTNGFTHRAIYVYVNDLSFIPEFSPKIKNYQLKIISEPGEVDELVKQGFDFSSYCKYYRNVPELKQTLIKGAILFAVFVGQELAHTTWVTLNEEAKQDIDTVPYTVDFQSGEVCSGDSETNPKYRRLGLYAYTRSKVFYFLKQNGFSRDRFAINEDNIASRNTLAKFNSRICTKGVMTRVLLWSFWREKPVKGSIEAKDTIGNR